MGILSSLGNGGGILANRPRLGGFLSNNANALLGFGAGIFSGQGPSAIGQGFQGFMQGSQLDLQAQERRRQEEEQAEREAALQGVLSGLALDPAQYELATQYPEYGMQLASEHFAPEPVEAAAAPDYPSSVEEYLFGLENPDYLKWRAANGDGGVNVTVNSESEIGTIPPDYELFTDPKTGERSMRVIPGSPTAQAIEEANEQQAGRRATELTTANIVVEDIDFALDLADAWTTGLLGAGVSLVPGTPAYDLKSLLTTIKSNVGFAQLQHMRENSPTGGALGPVSDFENRQLQAVLGNLEQSQSEAQFRRNLERLKVIYLDIIHGAGNWTYGPGGEVMLYGADGTLPDAAPAAEDPDPFGIL